MRGPWEGISALGTVLALGAGMALPAQQGGVLPRQAGSFAAGHYQMRQEGDHHIIVMTGGLLLAEGELEMRAERGVLVLDRDALPALFDRPDEGPLPRRGATPPDPRRTLDEALLRARLRAFARALSPGGAPPVSAVPFQLGTVHSLYLEGDVIVLRGGRQLVSGESFYVSMTDDRAVLRGGEMRLWSRASTGEQRVHVVRADVLTRQGRRTTARNASITPCSAGLPHLAFVAEQVEIIQHERDFEIRPHGSALVIHGTRVLPLPDISYRTGDQSPFPIRGATAGYSNAEGVRAGVDIGGSLNDIGGSVHEWLTGRPAHEFRGDWRVGIGYNEARGVPIDTSLVYTAPGVYRGYLEGFWLDDHGTDRREIQARLDGSPINAEGRHLVRTENRVRLGEETWLDLSAFTASDPAVLPEFYPREYREAERPETGAYFRTAGDNRLLTLNLRANLNEFSYASDRSLAPRFVAELPMATFHMFSEPLVELYENVPVLLTSAGSAGLLRSDFAETLMRPNEDVLRIDEELEIAVPFQLGPIGIRPFGTARLSNYNETAGGEQRTRFAFAAGIRAGTWLARTFGAGGPEAIRHVISPQIVIRDWFQVDGDPLDLPQLDAVDTLDERTEVRLELLNRLQRRTSEIHEFLWLDLAQTLLPHTERDNDGDLLGLLEYELLLNPPIDWVPIPGFAFLLEGEHDWSEDEARTFNVRNSFGRVLGLYWHGEYRADRNADGTIGYGTSTGRVGRWAVAASSQYDLDRDETLNYVASLTRFDHDWQLQLGVVYDTIGDETRFFVHFEPLRGIMVRSRDRYYVSGWRGR